MSAAPIAILSFIWHSLWKRVSLMKIYDRVDADHCKMDVEQRHQTTVLTVSLTSWCEKISCAWSFFCFSRFEYFPYGFSGELRASSSSPRVCLLFKVERWRGCSVQNVCGWNACWKSAHLEEISQPRPCSGGLIFVLTNPTLGPWRVLFGLA